MNTLSGRWIIVAGAFGAIGIAIGAFGAHGLPDWLAGQGYADEEVSNRLETFETGARYHMFAALALLGIGLAEQTVPGGKWSLPGWLLLTGACVFSGLLYALAVAGPGWRWLGAVVPIGGLLQIGGWVAIAAAARRLTSAGETSPRA